MGCGCCGLGWVGGHPSSARGHPPPPLHPARGDTHKTRTSPARGCPAWGAHAGGTALGGGRGRGATSWLGDRGQPGRWRSQFTRGCSESQSREARGEFLGLRRVQKERVSGGSKGEKIKKSLKKKKNHYMKTRGDVSLSPHSCCKQLKCHRRGVLPKKSNPFSSPRHRRTHRPGPAERCVGAA